MTDKMESEVGLKLVTAIVRIREEYKTLKQRRALLSKWDREYKAEPSVLDVFEMCFLSDHPRAKRLYQIAA